MKRYTLREYDGGKWAIYDNQEHRLLLGDFFDTFDLAVAEMRRLNGL